MSIDKIGSVNNYNGYAKINKVNQQNNVKSSDSVDISSEALDVAEKNRILEIVKSAPDVRVDKIKEIKEKLKNPNYINDTLVKGTADNIMKTFGI
ncbi:MAG: hypothetical protein A2086_04610 [Spirochaetes bacterium GWD1_27_9]|nr:MAG: hypothetical protein A2Z98_13700 [Spirochaetes bacterium GWB1_27_13]OHD25844.1 MAG: hypothetical protein A2Y34_03420 [Spirochaetes bacterium GWC1_27_15]OHD30354.1 MAG: hypothetical protein A2086_04610 [Spirochaetes bacterium GWD1_27_9]